MTYARHTYDMWIWAMVTSNLLLRKSEQELWNRSNRRGSGQPGVWPNVR